MNMISRSTFLKLGTFTLFGFSAIGYLIAKNTPDVSIISALEGNKSFFFQSIIGVAFGLLSAIIGWKIIETNYLKPVRLFFSDLIQKMNLKLIDIIFVSICAGIGEEILFRGAVQPLLGIWLTSIIFVAIHGYLNPSNLRLSIYGVYMTLVIAIIGYLRVEFGLLTCFVAHTVIDIYLLYKLNTDSIVQDEPNAM